MKKRVVILYAKTGGGHRSLAIAMSELLQKNPEYEVELVDPFPLGVVKTYEVFGSSLRFIWGAFWHLTNSALLRSLVSFPSRFFIFPALTKTLQQLHPDVVITNHPLLCDGLRDVLIKAGCADAKIIVHVADPFTPHAVWFTSKDVNAYFLPTNQTKDLAISYGIPASKCHVIGWLLRHQFTQSSGNFAYAPNVPYIFIGSGGQGSGNTFELVKEIIDHPSFLAKYACVVSTGSNTILAQAIKLYGALKNMTNVLILPSTDAIDEYMRGACFVVGKLGPNFLFESLALEKPILVTSYIPGQEDGNIEYVKRERIGWIKLNTASAFQQMYTLLEKTSWNELQPQVVREKKKYITDSIEMIQQQVAAVLK